MVQERAGGDGDRDVVASPFDGEVFDRLDRVPGLAFDGPESGEIMRSGKNLAGRSMPGPASVYDTVVRRGDCAPRTGNQERAPWNS